MLMLVLLCVSSCHLSLGVDFPLLPLTSSSSPATERAFNCSSDEGVCPAGLFCFDGQCKCEEFPHDLVRCEGESTAVSLWVLKGYCITYDDEEEVVLVGACAYSNSRKSAFAHVPYYSVQPGRLNDYCTEMNKMGTLCGSCLPNHYPLAYSYNMTCIPCPHARWNWLWYVMAAYLPLTLFYFVILFFKINIMHGHMHMAISVCQALSFPAVIRTILAYFKGSTYEVFFSKILLSIYAIWNLDFFRPFYTDLCLGIGILPTLALDYAIAVCPLLLMVVSYLLITLYDRNYRVVTVLWSPFRRLFSLFRRNWDIRTTLVDAFATFFFLSNIKFLSVSSDLLVPIEVYRANGSNSTHSLGLFYSADIEYFGKKHLPYAILAVVVVCLFVILPVILVALYPFRFFQRFLNRVPFCWYILHTFMDSFQGCYKDGTEPGTRDHRYFLSVFFILRICIFMVHAVTLTVITYAVVALLLIVVSTVVMATKPFKTPPIHSNMACAAYLQLLTFLYSIIVAIDLSASVTTRISDILIIIGFLAFCVPLVDAIRVFVMLFVRRRRGILQLVVSCCRRWNLSNGYEELLGGGGGGSDSREEEEVQSDRSENPEREFVQLCLPPEDGNKSGSETGSQKQSRK